MVDVSKAQLEANLRAALQMREAAEREARHVKEVLVDLARQFLASEIDAFKRQESDDPEQWPARKLGEWMKEKLRARANRLEFAARAGSPEVFQRTQAEIERLQALVKELQARSDQLAAVEAELARAQETIKALEAELSGLRQEAARLREEVAQARRVAAAQLTLPIASPATTSPGAPPSDVGPDVGDATPRPEWFDRWQTSRGFDSEQAVLRVLGFQGLCLRQSIEGALAREGTAGATVWRALERLQDRGLVEQKVPGGESRGRTSHFYWLTDRGRQAFRWLYGQEPVESEYHRLRARHKGDEHIALNLQARDLFAARGATVDLYPQRVVIPSEFYHDPDLVVVFPGEDRPLYVECERGVSKLRTRDNKWAHYATVTSDFYFVVPNDRVQSGILSEVTEWVIRTQQPAVTVRICNLSALTGDESPLWSVEKTLRGRRR